MFLCLFAVGCAEKAPSQSDRIVTESTETKEKKLELNAYTLSLEKLEEFTLSATIDGEAAQEVVWESIKEDVATVANGKISALSAGTSVIIATCGGLEARCSVNVSDHGLIPGITTNIDDGELFMMQGDEFDLVSTVTYNNVTVTDAVITATISENNAVGFTDGKIVAKEQGSAMITISATWHGITCDDYVFAVSVVPNVAARLHTKNSITLCNDENGGAVTDTLVPSLVVNDETVDSTDYEIVKWKYDEKIISVDNGVVTGLAKGNTEIVATFMVKETGVTVDCVLPVSVYLYAYDKTESIRLDTMYLDMDEYVLALKNVFADKDDLADCAIGAVMDVTDVVACDIPFEKDALTGNARIDVAATRGLGVEGDRKWKVDCGKYSYIITVPTQAKHFAAPLLGSYAANNWTYNATLSFVENKDTIAFTDADGKTVAYGLFTLTPWDNSETAGSMKITLNSGKLYAPSDTGKTNALTSIVGHYYYASGCYQLHIAIGSNSATNIIHYYKDIQAPYSVMAGTYESGAAKITLNEDKTCVMENVGQTENLTYTLTPDQNDPLQGTIAIGTEYTGRYAYDKGGAKLTVAISGDEIEFAKAGTSGEPYTAYAGYYVTPDDGDSAGVWIRLRLEADGTFAWNFEYYCSRSTVGTYVMENGVIVMTPENSNTGYGAQFVGTYYEEDGKYYVKIDLLGDRIYEKQ